MSRFMSFVLLFISSTTVFAWWDTGHMVVANIAYQNLNDEAKKSVAMLLPKMAQENTDAHQYNFDPKAPNHSMMKVSLWPDNLHQKPNYLFTYFDWHFIDEPILTENTQVRDNIPTQHVVWALKTLSKNLKQKKANASLRARSLAMIIHFTGDIHQPLHNAEYYSNAHPKGDLGGNLFKLHYVRPNGMVLDNLHKLWDSGLNLLPKLGYEGDATKPHQIEQISQLITSHYPSSYFGQEALNTDINAWHKQSYQLAIKAYHLEENSTPSHSYIQHNTEIAEAQIALAGYRLGALLNALLS